MAGDAETGRNKALVADWVERVYNRRDPGAVEALASSASVEVSGDYLAALVALGALPDARATVKSLTAEGDTVSALLRVTGTHRGTLEGVPPTGRTVSFDKVDLFRVRDGRIAAADQSWNRAALREQLEGGGAEEPVLEIDDIQGNSLAGFNKNWQTFLFLRVIRAAPARAWLRALAPRISTVAEVLEYNRLYKAIRKRAGRGTPAVRATWINIAFTAEGLRVLGSDADAFTDKPFREGLHRRSALLGDPVEPAAAGYVENWDVGSSDRVPHLVVTVASDSSGWLGEEVLGLLDSLNDGLEVMYTQQGAALPFPLTGHEHFGFKDGVSQPGIRGRISDDPEDYLMRRQNPESPNQGKPGQDLVWPGEFVFGYPAQDPRDPYGAGAPSEAGPAWARNGSFMVFRKMRQDVAGFDAFARSAAAELARRYPALAKMSPELLKARMVGRWLSGAPTVRAVEVDDLALADSDCANNHFDYVSPGRPLHGGEGQCRDAFPPARPDPEGLLCPHAAHIRKSAPRGDTIPGGPGAAQRHRILRRGIAYGPPVPAEADRGLLFVAYQTSFERQFEFIQRNWLNNPDFLDKGDGHDPLCGQNPAPGRARTFILPVRERDGTLARVPVELPTDWIIQRGGGYFFSPSITALDLLCR
ncbi:MAG TPA: Dyp-type peroxidase [Longimicrobium sp.]|jgi:Dyp-type peroxidase family